MIIETATTGSKMDAISYRVKFNKQNFLELIRITRPRIIRRRKNKHFFAYGRIRNVHRPM